MEPLSGLEQRDGGNWWKRALMDFSWSLYERYRMLKSRFTDRGKVYSGQYMDAFDLSATQGGRRTAGGTVVLVNRKPLERRLYLIQGSEAINRVDRLSMLAEENPHISVDNLQAWGFLSGHIYRRDSEAGNEDIALNLLDDALGEPEARTHYQAFVEDKICSLTNRWIITEGEIREWVFERNG